MRVDGNVPDSFSGHPLYLKLTEDELRLHSAKNRDYARGGDALGNFKRVADILSNYPGLKLSDPKVVALVYAMKQLDAVLWMLSQSFDGGVENIGTRLGDCYVYFKIARVLYEEEKDGRTGTEMS